jgi:oligopeptide/dipeptide ABC transporter ATP-binding protein
VKALISARNIRKSYRLGRRRIPVLRDVSLDVEEGECLAIVGESGSGKTTLGRILLALELPDMGEVQYREHAISSMRDSDLRKLRPRFQMVFQEGYDSLSPRRTVAQTLSEALQALGASPDGGDGSDVHDLLERVHLKRELANRFPHELSSGQQQRVALARALGTNPDLLVLDEPTAALDSRTRSQIIRLLHEIQDLGSATFVLITHDLRTVRELADDVLILYLGRILEVGPNRSVFSNPMHPYTRALISSELPSDPREVPHPMLLKGENPGPENAPNGCVLRGRCSHEVERSSLSVPELREVEPGHFSACVRAWSSEEWAQVVAAEEDNRASSVGPLMAAREGGMDDH